MTSGVTAGLEDEEDEELLMQRALEMSMRDFDESVTAPADTSAQDTMEVEVLFD